MNILLKLFLLVTGSSFFFAIIYLLIKNKIYEKYSIVWLGGGFIILFLSGNPRILDRIASYLDITYPPSLLFLLSILVLLWINLYSSIEITKLNKKVKDLTQYISLKESYDSIEEMQSNVKGDHD